MREREFDEGHWYAARVLVADVDFCREFRHLYIFALLHNAKASTMWDNANLLIKEYSKTDQIRPRTEGGKMDAELFDSVFCPWLLKCSLVSGI